MDENKEKKDKRKVVNIIIIIFVTILIIIFYIKSQIIAVVRYDFTGWENLFHLRHEHYLVTKNCTMIMIPEDLVKLFDKDYEITSFVLTEDNLYRISSGKANLTKDYKIVNSLSDDQKKDVDAIYNALIDLYEQYRIITNSNEKDKYLYEQKIYPYIYTDLNNYFIEITETDDDSFNSVDVYTTYLYCNGKLMKMKNRITGDLNYIYFINK